MSDRNIGKPWTSQEDRILVEQVAVHGDVDKWKTICLAIPGRSNKACRKVLISLSGIFGSGISDFAFTSDGYIHCLHLLRRLLGQRKRTRNYYNSTLYIKQGGL
jgi:hypothetical protein